MSLEPGLHKWKAFKNINMRQMGLNSLDSEEILKCFLTAETS